MKRFLIVTVLGALLTSPTAASFSGVGAEPAPVPATTPEITSEAASCPSSNGLVVAQGGCCRGQGGICGCSASTFRCCNGKPAGQGCPCRTTEPTKESSAETL